jgi:hypothetical protein
MSTKLSVTRSCRATLSTFPQCFVVVAVLSDGIGFWMNYM